MVGRDNHNPPATILTAALAYAFTVSSYVFASLISFAELYAEYAVIADPTMVVATVTTHTPPTVAVAAVAVMGSIFVKVLVLKI